MSDYFLNAYSIKLSQKNPTELPFFRDQLPIIFNKMGFKVGAEVGVFRGEYTLDFFNAGLKVYAIDPWIAYHDYSEQQVMDSYYEETKQRLLHTNVEIIRKTSLDAVTMFADNSLDFVYIDGDHSYDAVLADMRAWYPKLKSGGVFAGHDYIRFRKECNSNVVEAVWQFVKENNVPYFFTTERKGRIRDLPKNSQRSWFWIKA